MVAPNFFYFHILYILLWKYCGGHPLVAGERIGRWMDGKSGKIGLKNTQFCYQLLSKVVISCYHVNSSKN